MQGYMVVIPLDEEEFNISRTIRDGPLHVSVHGEDGHKD
jgi:hypothetical protein